jgi:hypothetical protein
MSRLVLLIVSLFFLPSTFAETVYKYVDENGNTVFTDEPRKGAEVLDVQPIPTVPAIPVPERTSKPVRQDAFRYNKILIVSPEDQHNFINEVEPIVVQLAMSPALRSEDRVQLMLNGAPKGSPSSSTQFTLDSLDRGAYNVSVKVLDMDGNEVGSSPSIQFFIKRHSVNMPTRPKPTPQKPPKPKPAN